MGIEPTTLALLGPRSNQLSYRALAIFLMNFGELPEIYRTILRESEKRVGYIDRTTKKEERIEWLSFVSVYILARAEGIQIKRNFINNFKSFYYRCPNKRD